MKKLIAFLFLLPMLGLSAQIDLKFDLTDFALNPATNRTVWVTAMSVPTAGSASVVIGSKMISTTDNSGIFYISNVIANLYSCSVQGPPSRTDFMVLIQSTDSGLINAHSNLVAASTATFPAGSVAWSAASQNLRFAAAGTGGGSVTAGNNIQVSGSVVSTVTNPSFTSLMVSNPAAVGGSSAQIIISGNTGTGGKTDTITSDPSALGIALGGSGRYLRIPSTVTTGILTGDGSGLTNVVPINEYATNEPNILTAITTNFYFMSSAGDAGVNGTYTLKGTTGSITVWTNANGLSGLARDLGGIVFAHAVSITNSAGSVRYDKDDDNPLTSSSPWDVINGIAPAPTVVTATNFVTNSYSAYYWLPSLVQPGVSVGTNVYFVNPATGNDTNAIVGRWDRPWKNFTNVVWYKATHTNDTIALFPGTNYFGYQNIQVSNWVSIIGLGTGPDACWIDKDAGLVDLSDISLRPGIGSVFANFSGNLSLTVFKANVTFIGLHTIGYIDNLLPNTGATNFLSRNNVYEVNGPDSVGVLIDACVINGGYNTFIGDMFVTKRRGNSATGAGNATTRRAVAINGGTNVFTGCTFVSTDSTNGCYGVVNNAGYNIFSGCNGIAHNTNGLACSVTNVGDSVVIPEGPFSMVFSNLIAYWVSPHNIRIDSSATLLGASNHVSGILNAANVTFGTGTNRASSGSAIQATDANGKLVDAYAIGTALTNNETRSLNLLGASNYISGTLHGAQISADALTNGAAIASTLAIFDANKKEISLANGGANTVVHGTTPPTETAVVEADQSLSDVTTANVSITKHGYAPKAPNDATKYLDGTGAYSVPPGSGGGGWSTSGNAGLAADGSAFLGTTDAEPLFIKIDGTTAVWISPQNAPATSAPDFVFGGGTTTLTNQITSKTKGDGNFIAGGNQNLIQGGSNDGIFAGVQHSIQTNTARVAILGGSVSFIHSNANDSAIIAGTANDLGLSGTTVSDSAIVAGINNTNQGNYSIIAAGDRNLIQSQLSFAAGRRNIISHDGVFSWADSTDAKFFDIGQDTFSIRTKSFFATNEDAAGHSISFSNGVFTLLGSATALNGNGNPATNFSNVQLTGNLTATNGTDFIGALNFPVDLGGPLIDVSVTSATTGGTQIGYTNRIDGTDIERTIAYSDGSGGITNPIVQFPFGIASLRSNALASAAITFPATTVKWTNTFGMNIVLYIDNSGVTGTATVKNNQQIFSSLVGDVTLLLKSGDYFSETYTIGTPTARWEPQ